MNVTTIDFDILTKMQNAFAYHKIITDNNEKPIDYEFIYVNKAFEELTGLKADKTIGKRVTELILGIEDSQFNWIKFYGEIALKEIEDEIIQYFDVWNRWYKIHVYSPKKGYFVTVFSDVTDLKNIEIDIKNKSEIINKIVNNIDEIVYLQDIETGKYLYINPSVKDIYGIDLEELMKNSSKWLNIIDYKDKLFVEEKFKLSNKIKEIEEAGIFRGEFKIVSDNKYKYIKAKALPIYDENNKIIELIGVEEDVTREKELKIKLEKTLKQLEKMAMLDYLTEIYNRRGFFKRVEEEFEKIKRTKGKASIIMCDIDKFKNINDTYGHDIGDIVLKHLTKLLQSAIRKYDILGRFGGEEFIILLSNVSLRKV